MFIAAILLVTFPVVFMKEAGTVVPATVVTPIVNSTSENKDKLRQGGDDDGDGGTGDGGTSGVITDNEGFKLASGIVSLVLGGLFNGANGNMMKGQTTEATETEDTVVI